MLGVAEIDQRVQAGHGFENDVATLAAIAAVWAAIFDELLTPEGDGPGAARAERTKIFAWSRKCMARV